MDPETVNRITVNAKRTLMLLSTSLGFKVFDFSTMELRKERKLNGGIGPIDVLETTNILAMSGGGLFPYFPKHKVVIWEDHEGAIRAEIVFKSDVLNVKIKYEFLFVVLETKIFVYGLFDQLALKRQYATYENPKGILETNSVDSPTYFAILNSVTPSNESSEAKKGGSVLIVNLSEETPKSILAHTSAVICMKFDFKGNLFATASEKGTIVRLFDTKTGNKLKELRRGVDENMIYSIDFDLHNQVISCVSETGTIHVFSLEEDKNAKTGSWFSFWTKGERDITNAKVKKAEKPQLFFDKNNGIKIFSYDGAYYYFDFDISKNKIVQKDELTLDLLSKNKK